MKFLLVLSSLMLPGLAFSQNLQLHYDVRHTLDPTVNPNNFPSFTFEYFKNIDTVGTGSFLFKIQADMKGRDNNPGQIFTQLTQTLRFWKPNLYLSLNYSGGLGVTPNSYGFYLSNAYAVGISMPFQWKGAWISTALLYRYNAFDKPSQDPQLIFYFGRGFFNYKIFVGGSFVGWTENLNHGNADTQAFHGKKVAFFGDPQVWIKIKGGFSIGTRINVFYHLITVNDKVQFYPTIGTKFQF